MHKKMNSFEELQSQWNNQKVVEIPEQGHKLIMEKVKAIKNKQKYTNIVLTLTVLILVVFFIYISAYNYAPIAFALLLMMASLGVRIGLELHSIKTLKQLNVNISATNFKQSIIKYYKNRVRIHAIYTPIILLLYSFGFILMLPAFKESLSAGFYQYIVISSVLILLVLSVFIYKQIRKELNAVKELKDE